MSAKVAGTLHLTRMEWRILAAVLGRLPASKDPSVRHVIVVATKVADECAGAAIARRA